MYRLLLSVVLSLSVLLSTVVAAQDAEYTFTTLDVPLLGAIDTDAYAVNDSRQVVGAYRDSRIVWHGFLYQGGSFTEVTVGSCTQLFAYGMKYLGTNGGDLARMPPGVMPFSRHPLARRRSMTPRRGPPLNRVPSMKTATWPASSLVLMTR